jgi:hypothetical protein
LALQERLRHAVHVIAYAKTEKLCRRTHFISSYGIPDLEVPED